MIENVTVQEREELLKVKDQAELTWKDFLLQGNGASDYTALELKKNRLGLTWKEMLFRAKDKLEIDHERKNQSERPESAG